MKLFCRALPLVVSAVLVSCSLVNSSYTPEIVVSAAPKAEYEKVEYFSQQPSRVALRIGAISANGNWASGSDDLIIKAKKEAAKLGGDFIILEKSGVEKETVYLPGQSSYDSKADLSWGSNHGFGSSNATARSTGPSVFTTKSPWSIFSVWIYTPSQLGIRMDGNIVSGFHLNSDAEKAGLKVGDKVIGIDGFDIADQKAIHHLISILPGDKVKLTVMRDDKRLERQITSLPN